MAATTTISLLKASSFFFHRDNPRPVPLPPLKWRSNPILLLQTTTTTTTSSFSVQCVMNSKNCFMEEDEQERKPKQKPAVSAFMLGGVLFFAYDPYSAIAASGGIMGGGSSSSSSSSSSYDDDDYDDFSSPSFSFSISSPTNHLYSIDENWSKYQSFFYWFMIVGMAFISIYACLPHKSTVLKLQVCLMGMKRSLQRELDRIAETADTSTTKGLSYILRDTTLLLLRHPDCCISGYSSVDVKQRIEDGEKLFNKLCIEERRKFDEVTLVNVDNNKRQNTYSKGANGVSNEYIVITILVAAKGVHKLPAINGSADLKEALQKLGSISSNKTMAALQVLWTPQKENDTLTEQELREDYPLLRPLDKDQDTQPL